jgi:hypothetical protein
MCSQNMEKKVYIYRKKISSEGWLINTPEIKKEECEPKGLDDEEQVKFWGR